MKTAKAIPVEDIEVSLNDYKVKNNNNLGYYLAGLL